LQQVRYTSPQQELKVKSRIVAAQETPRSWRDRMAAILVVDDDDVIRDTLCELFSLEHTCQTADTAEQALAKLEAQPFDVVLTDISMPGLSGMELLERVLELYPGTPVIMVSGQSDEEQARRLIARGAFDYLLKPFRLEVVEESVKRALVLQD
jgi:DNA-binding NtrC family response regulator